jgi:hypothetical protein
MKTNADELALEYGLKRFPNVRRLTITPVAHGLPFAPWYKTPTIRELPPGLVCRPPRSWPQEQDDPRERDALCWHFASERHHWRGFCALSNALAKQHHNKIVEFVVDVNKTCTGINCRLFDTPNSEYRILVNLFKNPGFSRIDLALFTRENPPLQWPEDRKRYLHAALAGAKDLAHFSLSGSLDYRLERLSNLPPPIMLSEVLPMTIWKQLRHFGLSRVVVRLDDLVDILSQLPSSLRSVDLSFLQFQPGGGGNYIELLYRIRDALGWSDRPVAERPRITIQLTKTLGGPWTVRSILDVSASVNRFVYEHGESIPFISNSDEQHTIEVDLISDGIERFPFMPIRDRPFWAHRISLPRFSRNF